MPYNKLNIIMFNMSAYTDWQKGIVNRNYHILQELAKDERIGKIVAVDFLPIGFDWKRKLKYFYFNIVKGVKACDRLGKICVNGGETKFGDLTSRCNQITSKIYVYSSIDNYETVLNELTRIKDILELENLVVWSYNPFLPDLDQIKKKLNVKLAVFDAVDDWGKHPVYAGKKEILEKNYQKISQQADVIFTVSKELKDGLFGDGKSFANPIGFAKHQRRWIPNGVDVEHFNQQTKEPYDIKNINRPIIGYEGVIQDRLDIDLIKYLSRKNPDKSFVFVGWIWQETQKIINQEFADMNNVFFLGRKTYYELPNYIKSFDAAIIPHKLDEFTKSMNPLKLYEYLACGKPVVSASVAGVEEFKDFVKVAGNQEKFNQYLNEVLKEDNDELKESRIAAMSGHSWNNRVSEMMELVNN